MIDVARGKVTLWNHCRNQCLKSLAMTFSGWSKKQLIARLNNPIDVFIFLFFLGFASFIFDLEGVLSCVLGLGEKQHSILNMWEEVVAD